MTKREIMSLKVGYAVAPPHHHQHQVFHQDCKIGYIFYLYIGFNLNKTTT